MVHPLLKKILNPPLERCISLENLQWYIFYCYFILEFGFGVPVVTVVLEGGEDALKAVKESVKHGIPAVVVEGTRRAADILAFAHHNCQCHRQV